MTRNLALLIALIALLAEPAPAQRHALTSTQGSTSITYRLHHPLHDVDAVSKTGMLRIDCDPATRDITSVEAEVDVTSFDSGNSNRDSHAMEVVDALTYPEVTFLSTSVSRHGDSLTVAGKLTFHGITRNVTAKGRAEWGGGRLSLGAHFNISLTEFKIERPSLLMMPVADSLRFTLSAEFNLTQ